MLLTKEIMFEIFLGMHFIFGTLEQAPYTMFTNDSYKLNYFPENETYEVTNHIQGIFPAALDSMSRALNFTYSVYTRKDGVWGSPKKLDNGTVIFPGVFGDLMEGKIDMVVTSYAIKLERKEYIDFLTPFGDERNALIISRKTKWRAI